MTKDECELPSYHAALQFVEGEAYAPVVLSYIGRAALISGAFLIARDDWKSSLRNGLIASAAVEMYVLYKTYSKLQHCEKKNVN